MKRHLSLIGFPLIALFFTAHVWLFRGFFVDDAFITFRFVEQWTQGNGPVYNIGERVEGYSNFLWVVLLAPFDLLGVELVLAAKALGILSSLLTLLLCWRFARRFSVLPIAPLLLAVSGSFAAWAVGGLETPLFTFLLMASGYTFLREEERGTGWLSGVLFGLLALTRPEGLLFSLIAAVFRGWRLYSTGREIQRQDWFRMAALAAIVGPYFVWRVQYYGYLLPNTVYAKSMGLHLRAFLEGTFYIYKALAAAGGLFFLALPILVALVDGERSLSVVYLAVNVLVYGLFIVLSGGDWMPMQRFLVHLHPFLYLLVHAGLVRLNGIWRTRKRSLILSLLVLGQVGVLMMASLEQRFVVGTGRGNLIPDGGEKVAYLLQKVQPYDTIAVVDAGIIAYQLPLTVRIVDMVGLTDVHIAHLPVRFPGGLFGRGDAFGKWDVDYTLAQEPRFVDVNLREQTPDDRWETEFTGTALLINDSRFREKYQLVEEPGVSGLFKRLE